MRGRRVGVFGGTFDPPHIGHLVAAQRALETLDLDEVLMVVANDPWQKSGDRHITPAATRLELVSAAVAGVSELTASSVEIDRGGPTYTVDTLETLRAADPDVELFLILGADAAARIPTWHRAGDLAALCTVVVVDRPGAAADGVIDAPMLHVEVPLLEVSSTDLRARAAAGRSIRFLVPDAVAELVDSHGLYRAGPGSRVSADDQH